MIQKLVTSAPHIRYGFFHFFAMIQILSLALLTVPMVAATSISETVKRVVWRGRSAVRFKQTG